MEIRACRDGDVEVLERWQHTGLTEVHAARFSRQCRGLGTFLVAWADGAPVGSGEVRWDGGDSPEVREALPGCPEINGLQVWPAELRSRGIGTAIIGAAEGLARRRGRPTIGLGVADDNPAAARLYRRLGYTESGVHYIGAYHYITDDGVRHDVAENVRFLVKRL